MPRYLCWTESQDPARDNAWSIDVAEAEDAAEDFAEYAFHNMDEWESGGSFDVLVKRDEDGASMERFHIIVEAHPIFLARRYEPAEDPTDAD